jgi:hypothetical protein
VGSNAGDSVALGQTRGARDLRDSGDRYPHRMDGVYVEKHGHAVMVPKPVTHEHTGD